MGVVNTVESRNDTVSTHQTCPYLGCYWDRMIRSMVPDSDNRCFACEQRYRVWWVFHRTRPGARIELPRQQEVCYRDFRSCGRFRSREIPEF